MRISVCSIKITRLWHYIVTLLLLMCNGNLHSQELNDPEFDRLWNQVEFWEKAENIDKVIETKEKLVFLYRKNNPSTLPLMLRNIAASYNAKSGKYHAKANEALEEAINLISQDTRNDDNYSLYNNCLWDLLNSHYERKEYSLILSDINKYVDYVVKNGTTTLQNDVTNILHAKYNSIFLLNDSCNVLEAEGKYNSAKEIMSSYVSDFTQMMRNDIVDTLAYNLCIHTVWHYANVIEKLGEGIMSIELRELHNKYLRNNIDFYLTKGTDWDYLWVMERYLANMYRKIGKEAEDIAISKRIVDEARLYAPELLPRKLLNLGISYESNHTLDGRKMAEGYYLEALDIIDTQQNCKESVSLKIKIIDFLLAQYNLTSQYDKTIVLLSKYDKFLKDAEVEEDSEDEDYLMGILGYKSSAFHRLDYSIPESKYEAKIINDRLLEYYKRKYGQLSDKYLGQLRLNAVSGTYDNDEELDSIFERGYHLWQLMPREDNISAYASFVCSYCSYQFNRTDSINNILALELEKLCLLPQVGYHPKLFYYYDTSIFEYNHYNYEKALDYINKAQKVCEDHIESSEMRERLAQILAHKSLVAGCLLNPSLSKESAYQAYDIIRSYNYENLNIARTLSSLSYVMEEYGDNEKAADLAIRSFNMYYKCKGLDTPLDLVDAALRHLTPRMQIQLIDTLHLELFMSDPMVVPLLTTKASAHIGLNQFPEAAYYLDLASSTLLKFKDSSYYRIGNRYDMTESQIIFGKGVLCYKNNDLKEAIQYFKKYRNIIDPDHKDPLLWLNTLYAITKDSANFIQETSKTLNYIRDGIREHFIFLGNHEREIYMRDKIESTINEVESYAYLWPNNPRARSCAFNAVLLEKGLALSSGSRISNLIKNSGIDQSALNKLKVQFELANNQDARSAIQMKIDLEEQRLQKKLDVSSMMSEFMLDYEMVKKSIDSSSVVVEFIKYCSNYKDRIDDSDYHIGALILTKDCEYPYFMDLCSETKLQEIKKKGTNLYSDVKDLYSLIWAPIMKYIQKYDKVYFSPVGILYALNIEYVAEKENSNISFIRISSSRELVMGKKTPTEKNNAYFYGGLCYDCKIGDELNETRQFNPLNTIVNDTITRGTLAYLAGSLIEVSKIYESLLKTNCNAKLFTGDKGSERSFKMLSNNYVPILHLSTHGFSYGHNSIKDYDEPMRKCGLLMSGCQNAWNGGDAFPGDDGILLGEEISNIILKDNDIVVLSACDTGLGISNSEGVWGLQRAFKKAGARSILMSLWKVNDIATSLFMEHFYKSYMNGALKQDALKDAREFVKDYKDSEGNKPFESPYYWASWIFLDAFN